MDFQSDQQIMDTRDYLYYVNKMNEYERSRFIGFKQNPLLDYLNERVEFTDNLEDMVEFVVLVKIIKDQFPVGSRKYRAVTKPKILDMIIKDAIWSKKMDDCRMSCNGLKNVFTRLRLK